MKLTFITRHQSVNKEILTLYCRITRNKQVREIMLPLQVNNKWERSRSVLNYLEKVKKELSEIHLNLLTQDIEPTAEKIKQAYLDTKKTIVVSVVFKDYINTYLSPKVRSGEIQEETITVMGYTVNHLKNFLVTKHGTEDIDAKAITRAFIAEFESYLRFHDNIKSQHNSVMKHLQRMKRVFEYAVRVRESIPKNPFDGYEIKKVRTEAVYLTADELKRIINKKGLNERLEKVRDIFVFQCLTGFAFIDMEHLVEADVSKITHMVIKKRQKTKVEAIVPLSSQAIRILEKYSYRLPVSSNQKMNAYLKEIAVICDVNKTLTTHVARHTCATTVMLQNGVSLHAVSKILGHSSVKMTEHYAKISPEVIGKIGKANEVNIEKYFEKAGSIGD
jgi:site-specific recombinase XerD